MSVPKLSLRHADDRQASVASPTSTAAPADLDWNCADEVAAHVSKATLEGMQSLWKAHAANMDGRGRDFAEKVYALHSQAIQEVAGMKSFELRPVLSVLNTFTASVRESVLQIFQEIRRADDDFAQALYQASRRAFTRNLGEALEAKDAMVAEKIQRLKVQHEQVLMTQRKAAAVQQAAAVQDTRAMVVMELRSENKKKLQEAVAAITAMVTQGQLAAAPLPAAPPLPLSPAYQPPAGGSSMQDRPQSLPKTSSMGATSPGAGGGGAGEGGWPEGEGAGSATGRQNQSAWGERGSGAAAAAAAAAAATVGPPPTTPPSARGSAAPGLNLDVLRAFAEQHEDDLGSVLVQKELEAALKITQEDLEQMKARVEHLSLQLQQDKTELSNWKDKWAQESTKTDSIKKECMQIVLKCEQRVQALQGEHMSEMSKRDYILNRAKETIKKLEAHITELTGEPMDSLLVSYDSPRFPTSSLSASITQAALLAENSFGRGRGQAGIGLPLSLVVPGVQSPGMGGGAPLSLHSMSTAMRFEGNLGGGGTPGGAGGFLSPASNVYGLDQVASLTELQSGNREGDAKTEREAAPWDKDRVTEALAEMPWAPGGTASRRPSASSQPG